MLGRALAQLLELVLQQEVAAAKMTGFDSLLAVMAVGVLLNLDGMVGTH